MCALFTARAGRRRRWSPEDALLSEGPICAAVLDVKAAVLQATRDVHDARRLLELPVRVSEEANMRAMLFYFWCKQTGPGDEVGAAEGADPEHPLSDWEATLNTLDHAVHTFVVEEVRDYTCAMRASAAPEIAPRLEHLERIVFHARRLARIATEIVPAPSPQSDTVSEWLPEVGVFCQSDLIQKKCRELYLLLAVSPYEMEASDSPNAFSCLCTVANARVNELVERASAPLQAVVKAGPEEHPHVYAVAALCVFCEFLRCKRALDILVHTLHDAHAARDGSFLLETRDQIYLRVRGKWEGPYGTAGRAMTRWEALHGSTDRSDLRSEE
jgi:hypothetical protein